MAQTSRTFAQLEVLLADNTAKGIGPTDLRDFLESAMGCYGSMYADGGSTAASIGATFALLVPPWSAAGPYRNVVVDLAGSELEINADGIYRVTFSASGIVTGATDRFAVEGRNLGVKIAGLTAEVTGTLTERIYLGFSRSVSLESGDTVAVWAKAVGGVGDLTIEHAQLSVDRVG